MRSFCTSFVVCSLSLSCTPPASEAQPPVATSAPVEATGDASAGQPTPSPSASSAAMASSKGGSCSTVLAAERGRFDQLLKVDTAKAAAQDPNFRPEVHTMPDFLATCIPTKGGKWATHVHKVEIGPEVGFSARWSLDFVPDAGSPSSVFPTEQTELSDGMNYSTSMSQYTVKLAAYDYDADGISEMIVSLVGDYHEGEDFAAGRVYTAKTGHVESYAPAAKIVFDEVKDVDQDGRPDLLFHGPFDAVVESCGSGFGYRVKGPLLVAHAKGDGTFALSDDVAEKQARSECPKKPARIVEKGSEERTEVSARNVACSRLWGASPGDLKKRVGAECKLKKPVDQCPPNTCVDGELLDKWTSLEPPLVLK
jgi:hypothetical protein